MDVGKIRAITGRRNVFSEQDYFFVTVRRIYFTLPREQWCYDFHCLGKKPGCKLGETHLERSVAGATLFNSAPKAREEDQRGEDEDDDDDEEEGLWLYD
ncbi:hypothetical protein C0J50_10997 [Silurus asotus]|uniref:Uncharacterized protein n=1 Tax=Silurus asotus TaxID=30991 RepID=A0AAD5ADW7_SILAS|nr:hypothetical protein C0J50_10997 [Silurus asotus]